MGLICGIVFGGHGVFGGGRPGQRRSGAEAFKLVEGSIKGAFDAGFIARKGFDGARAGSVVSEGAGTGIEVGRIFVAWELRHAETEQTSFEGAHAAQAPCGHGHLLNEHSFGWAVGLVLIEKSIA